MGGADRDRARGRARWRRRSRREPRSDVDHATGHRVDAGAVVSIQRRARGRRVPPRGGPLPSRTPLEAYTTKKQSAGTTPGKRRGRRTRCERRAHL